MFNWIRKLFSKTRSEKLCEETRLLTYEAPEVKVIKLHLVEEAANNYIAWKMNYLILDGKLKKYKNISKFITEYRKIGVEYGRDVVAELEPTKEMISLAKTWNLLQYKCENKEFDRYMKSLL